MSKYLYISCLSNFFITDEPLSYEEEYCETCGDSDHLVGTFDTDEERKRLEKEWIEDW